MKNMELDSLLTVAENMCKEGKLKADDYRSIRTHSGMLLENDMDEINSEEYTPYEPGVLGDIISIEGDYYKYSKFKKFFKLSGSECFTNNEYKRGVVGRIVVSHQLPPCPFITANVLVYNGAMSFVLSLSINGVDYEHHVTKINRLQLASHKFRGINTEVRVTRINDALELICEKDGEEWMFGFSFKKEGFWIPEKNFTEFDIAMV